MFVTRLMSGIVLVLLAGFLLIRGGVCLFAVSALVSMIGLFELYRVLKIEKELPGVIGFLSALLYYAVLWTGKTELMIFLFVACLMALMTVYVVTFPKFRTEQITAAFFGLFYVGVMFSYVYQVRNMPDGGFLVWLILLSSWGCDTCAYCFGMLFGKHKLAPKLSPKKSIEGALGGVFGAALLGFLFGLYFDEKMGFIPHAELIAAAACAIGAVISQIGDLAASAIKRNHDIKDYGHLIPGHGGILDRFDSMIFTAPAIYYAVLFIARL